MKKLVFGIVLLTVQFGMAQLYPIFEDPINVTQYKLKNGLTVVLSENHDTPTVMGAVIVKAGGKNDPKDATGMAHYLEHMLFKGTQTLGTTDYQKEKVYLDKVDSLYEELGKEKEDEKRLAIQKQINEQSILAGQYAIPNEMDRMLSEIGGENVNAFTSNDMTVYHNSFPSNKMEEWLSIYSHRFVDPVFRLFQSELETVYEEKNRGNESPFNHAFEVFMKGFFKNHPYGTQSIIGETEHLKNPSLKKMYEYFDTYYVANNMVLCLVGDFKIDEVRPLIDAYFSNWRTGTIPEFPEYKEDDFKAGESVTINATPVKLFARGYRTPQFGTYDALAMEIVTNMLSNEQGSGLFDEIVDHGELMALEAMPLAMKDHGLTLFLTVPKILGQSFEKANAVLDEAIARLIKGDFSDDLFKGAKNQWIKDFDSDLEDAMRRAYRLIEVYGNGKEWFEYLNFAKAIRDIKKDELVMIAQKYFSKNPFTLYSKMGKIKPEKLSKPPYDPVIPNNETASKFYEEWAGIQSDVAPKDIISLKDSIQFGTLTNGAEYRLVNNSINDIFELDIVWEAGYRQAPELEKLARLLNNSTTSNYDLNTFKNKLYALGTSLFWEAGEHELTLSISGLDENFAATMDLVNELLQKPVLTKRQIATTAKQVKTERKLFTSEMQQLSAVLREYALFGQYSKYLLQPSTKDYQKTSIADFDALYTTLSSYKVHVNYSGKQNEKSFQEVLNKVSFTSGTNSSDGYVYTYNTDNSNVYYLNDSKGVQSHITFTGLTDNYSKEDMILTKAFNFYFGFDMSSILFQEIREFRSLAYSTYGFVREAKDAKNKNIFLAYVGSQGDKTSEALNLLHQLIREMPVKKERANAIEKSIKNAVENSNPSFRDYIGAYESSIAKGFDDNMNLELNEKIASLSFDKMVEYYQKNVQKLDLKLSVVGNKKKFDTGILSDFGSVSKVSLKKVFKY